MGGQELSVELGISGPLYRNRAGGVDGSRGAPGFPLTLERGLHIVARMCTLILGVDVVAPGSVLLAANRDEDPGRPADPPGVLSESPRLVGGRDRRAGGTWLAVRERRAVVALLNRRDRSGEPAPPTPGRRSRGALVLDVASAAEEEPPRPAGADPPGVLRGAASGGPRLPLAALRRAMVSCQLSLYSPCSLVFASPEASWWMALEGDAPPRFGAISPGWHVLTHADLDDPGEPRTARLVRELEGFAPGSQAEAERRLDALLASHGEEAPGLPPVCLHHGRMVTVSSSRVWLAADTARYRHAEGRPCEHPLADVSALLEPANLGSRSANRPR